MKKILLVILLFAVAFPGLCQEETPMEITGSRKGVRTSTDIAVIAMPVATLAIAIAKQDWKGIALGAGECAGTFAVTYGLKYLVKKKRPDSSDNHSFPSGHTSLAFADASFVMRRYGWKFGVPMYAVAGYVAWGRTYAKKHDFWDVLAGAGIGAAVGLLCTTPLAKEHELTLGPAVIESPTPDGSNTFINIGVGGSIKF
ncbi:MAG: phosphatase PAP2 family protein [Prevotella sp.]|nr:phosphatase PAP2 family protein [Prevotella sp.]MCM1074833.1 phosphatase PAP2 family protein [Ruminococcus sp.]